jgi:hypothetical protein
LEESIARGITPAEELLDKYFNDWGQSVEPIFEEYAYYCRSGRARLREGRDPYSVSYL